MSDIWKIGKVCGITFTILIIDLLSSVLIQVFFIGENIISAGVVENLYLTDMHFSLRAMEDEDTEVLQVLFL